ncbi:MAG: iron-containing alcohol dehydrogenase, partial [Actinobacteria bacterium]
MIVSWGFDTLGPVLAEVGSARPFVVASERWSELEPPFEPTVRWTEVPSDRIEDATAAAKGADAVVAIGGGSAIDLGKAISA